MRYSVSMWRSGLVILILLNAGCANERPPVERNLVTGQSAARPSHTAVPTGDAAKAAASDPNKLAVNKDLLRQGYHTTVRSGQLFYCRSQALTGTRFKSNVCMREEEILDEQRRAHDTLTAPRQSQCIGPECSS